MTASKVFDAFGNELSNSGSWSSQFAYAGKFGYQQDSDTGLKLLGHRYYDPSTGRFLTRDPIKDGRNWYSYCENNPVSYFDAEGLQSAPMVFVAIEPGGKGNGSHAMIGIWDGSGDVIWFGFWSDGRVKIERGPSPKAEIFGFVISQQQYLALKKAIYTQRRDGRGKYDLQYNNCMCFVWDMLIQAGIVMGEEENSVRSGVELKGGLSSWLTGGESLFGEDYENWNPIRVKPLPGRDSSGSSRGSSTGPNSSED